MNRFLREQDYLGQIQQDNLYQIIQSATTILEQVEKAAVAEMRSYLAPRYRVDKIFSGWTTYSSGATYYGDSLIQSGDTFYYALKPAPEYAKGTTYQPGDVVFYDNHTYTALQETCKLPTVTGHWSDGTLYSFSGIAPDNTSRWVQDDNRNHFLVMTLIDIVLYHVHSRINPKDIPTTRIVRYDGGDPKHKAGAIGWLCQVANGEITAELPEILPSQGISFVYGNSNTKFNSY